MANPQLPWLIRGVVKDIDEAVDTSGVTVYAYNLTTEESISTTSNSSGEFILDCANFASGYTNGDVIKWWAGNPHICTRATLIADETMSETDIVNFQMTANGGNTWEDVTNGTEHTFTQTGNDLRWKAVFVGTEGASTYIENLKINYTIGGI